jgi:hypothetical protein
MCRVTAFGTESAAGIDCAAQSNRVLRATGRSLFGLSGVASQIEPAECRRLACACARPASKCKALILGAVRLLISSDSFVVLLWQNQVQQIKGASKPQTKPAEIIAPPPKQSASTAQH